MQIDGKVSRKRHHNSSGGDLTSGSPAKRKKAPSDADIGMHSSEAVSSFLKSDNAFHDFRPPRETVEVDFSQIHAKLKVKIGETVCLLGTQKVVARTYDCNEMSTGLNAFLTREIILLQGVRPAFRVHHLVLDPKDDRQRLVWPETSVIPSLVSSPYKIDKKLKKAWLYQTFAIMNFFHGRGSFYRNIIIPADLAEGRYTAATRAYVRDCKQSSPNLICIFGNDLMRLGNLFAQAPSLLTHQSPEELLGAKNLTPSKDLWAAACFIHDLYQTPAENDFAKPLIRDDETNSRFAHLMRLFKFTGTPTEATWPGVSKLPYYNSHYPQWKPPKDLRDSLSKSIPKLGRDLIAKLLVADPKKRLSAREALEHPFFADIHCLAHPAPVRKRELRDSWKSPVRTGLEIKTWLAQMHMKEGRRGGGVIQNAVTPDMREKLIDWLVQVTAELHFSQDTLFVAVQLIDRILSIRQVAFLDFQLLGVACILIAAKAVDTVRITLGDLADITAEIYNVRKVRNEEKRVLNDLSFDIDLSTAMYFLRIYTTLLQLPFHSRCLARRLTETALLHISTLKYKPSTVAFAAVTLAVSGGNPTPPPALLEVSPGSWDKCCVDDLLGYWEIYKQGSRYDDGEHKIAEERRERRERRARDSSVPSRSLMAKYGDPELMTVGTLQHIDVSAQIRTERRNRVGPRRDPATRLPAAVMLKLLHYLDKPETCMLACVSKAWQRVCHDPKLSKGEWDLEAYREVIDAKVIPNIVPRLVGVQALNLFRCPLTVDSINLIFKECKHLKRLNLSYTSLDESHLMGGLTCFPVGLENLNLRSSTLFDEKEVASIVENCRNIKTLNLGMLKHITSGTIDSVVGSLAPVLEELHLNSCPNIQDKDLAKLADCKALRRLYLDMCSKITDVGVTSVVEGCQLEVLSLCANRVSDASLKEIATHCPELRQLELSFCYLVSTNGVLQVANSCRKITHMNLCLVDMIADKAIETLAENCNLKELNLRGCTHITDRSLEALAQHCRELEVLHLLGCDKVSASTVAVKQMKMNKAKIIIW